jgi:hypothetical protein
MNGLGFQPDGLCALVAVQVTALEPIRGCDLGGGLDWRPVVASGLGGFE